MLICRVLSFSLFLYSFLPSAITCQSKCNESEFEIKKATSGVELKNVPAVEPSLQIKNDYSIDEEPPDDLEGINSRDESISQIVDSFVQSIEGFWQETRRSLNEYRKRKLPPGQWWLKDVENDYRAMKENFFNALSPNTPQQCLEILADYEVRYNDLMWAEVEKEMKRIQSIGDSDDEEETDICYTSNEKPLRYGEESLDDAYSAMHEKEMSANREQTHTEKGDEGKCKKPAFSEVMNGAREKTVTPLNCGEGNTTFDGTAQFR